MEWKALYGELVGYKVSDAGLITLPNGEIKEARYLRNGYIGVQLDGRFYYLHYLVAMGFLGAPEVNHKDGNKLNNDPSNLEWVSTSENASHAWRTGLIQRGIHRGKPRKVTWDKVLKSRATYANGDMTVAEISRELGISYGCCSKMLRGLSYKTKNNESL